MTTRAPAVLITTAIPKARGPKARSPIRAPSILFDPGRLTRSLLKSEKWRVSHTGVSVCGPLWPLFVHLFAHLWVRRPHFSCLSFNPSPLMQAAERKILHSAPTPSPILFLKKKKRLIFIHVSLLSTEQDLILLLSWGWNLIIALLPNFTLSTLLSHQGGNDTHTHTVHRY